jgi:anti-sigma factor RsiW
MTRNWHNPDRPTPAELAAWVDGELEAADAARVEAWLADHPDEAADAESSSRLAGLFRDHPPPEPSSAAWDRTFSRIAAGAARPRRPRWPVLLILGLAGAAAILAAVAATGSLWPKPGRMKDGGPVVKLPADDDNDEPLAVATAGEIDVLNMDAKDAGRVMIGPLLDPFEIASPDDVDLVAAEEDDEGGMPKLQKGQYLMVVVVRADDKDP